MDMFSDNEMNAIVINVNGKVEMMFLVDADDAEERFASIVEEYGVDPTDVDFSNGYIELEDATICLVTTIEH